MDNTGKKRRVSKLALRLIVILVLAEVIVNVLTTISTSNVFETYIERKFSKIANGASESVAAYIDGADVEDLIEKYLSEGETDDKYWEVNKYVSSVRNSFDLEYCYVVVPYRGYMVYIWDSGAEGDSGVCSLLETDGYYQNGEEYMMNIFEGKNVPTEVLTTSSEEYGRLISAYAPIKNSAGKSVALAGADISLDIIYDEIDDFTHNVGISMGVIAALFIIGYFLYIHFSVVAPIDKLSKEAENFVGDASQGAALTPMNEIKVVTKDEIRTLSSSIKGMGDDIIKYIDNLKTVTAERERIGAELNVATQIQLDMLPTTFPPFPNHEEFDLYASMRPAKEVGGDFYDFFLIDDDHLAMVIADVSGKGVPAALFMVISKTLIKNQTMSTGGVSPAAVLATVNNQLCENNKAEMFVTVWLGIMEISTGKIIAANAGHEYPAIKDADGSFELFNAKHNFIVGGMEGVKYTDVEMQLNEGGTLFVYTDGVAEATDANDELFGTERMLNALNSVNPGDNGTLDPTVVIEHVQKEIDGFVGSAPQFDDITMLCVTRKKH